MEISDEQKVTRSYCLDLYFTNAQVFCRKVLVFEAKRLQLQNCWSNFASFPVGRRHCNLTFMHYAFYVLTVCL